MHRGSDADPDAASGYGYGNARTTDGNARTTDGDAGAAYGNASSAYADAGTAYSDTRTAHVDAGTTDIDAGSTNGNTGSAYGDAGAAYIDARTAYGDTRTAYGDTRAAYGDTGSTNSDADAAYVHAGSAYVYACAAHVDAGAAYIYGNPSTAYADSGAANGNTGAIGHQAATDGRRWVIRSDPVGVTSRIAVLILLATTAAGLVGTNEGGTDGEPTTTKDIRSDATSEYGVGVADDPAYALGQDSGAGGCAYDTRCQFDASSVPDAGRGIANVAAGFFVVEPATGARDTFIRGIVTHYGESYNGGKLGCGNLGGALDIARSLGGAGDGFYRSSDPTIAASAWRPDGSRAYPCGTVLVVSGAGGSIRVVVGDACPGCAWNHLDLSESGIEAVCGGRFTCSVTISRVE